MKHGVANNNSEWKYNRWDNNDGEKKVIVGINNNREDIWESIEFDFNTIWYSTTRMNKDLILTKN